jgi:hypothetical protein
MSVSSTCRYCCTNFRGLQAKEKPTSKPQLILKYYKGPSPINSMVWVGERTIPTERPPLVGEVSANFCR